MIYLDNASTTKIDPEVLEEMMPYLTDEYGNAGTLYGLGFSAKRALDKARERVADFFGAENPEQIIFTSGGTESNNMVFHSYGFANKDNEQKRGVIVSSIEHDSVLRSADFLKAKLGFDVYKIKPNNIGVICADNFEQELMGKNLGLASIMYVNNEIGSINEIEEIASLCHSYGMLLHSDCVQAAGCVDIDMSKMGFDYASISSHKIHGPKGVGALFSRSKLTLSPMIAGGAAQEFGLRGGTENVAGIVGFGKACELSKKNLYKNDIGTCKRVFWNVLCSILRENSLLDLVHDNALSSIKHGKVLSVTFEGVDAEALVLLLGTKGVCVSAGSACSSHEQKPSHVLTGIGLSDDGARNTIRISFSRMNTVEEAKEAAGLVAESAIDLWGKMKP